MSDTDKPAKRLGNRAGYFQPLRDPGAAAAARTLYESIPGATCASVAAKVGVPAGTIRRWKSDAAADGAPWRSTARTVTNITGLAGELANTFKAKMTELGKPMDDSVAQREAEKAVSQEFAIDVRAQLLDRHRREWSAPRKIAYDAMSETDVAKSWDKAKLAKISAETLMLIQTGECRAWGLDLAARGADDKRTLVTIEREDAPAPGAAPPDEDAGVKLVSGGGETSTGGDDTF